MPKLSGGGSQAHPQVAPRLSQPFSFVAFGQSGLPSPAHSAIAALINNIDLGADFFISAGDVVIRNNTYDGPAPDILLRKLLEPARNVEAVDHRLYNPYAEAMSRNVFYLASGDEDHETFIQSPTNSQRPQTWSDHDAAYVLPQSTFTYDDGPPPLTETTELWYSFDFGNAHFTFARSSVFHAGGVLNPPTPKLTDGTDPLQNHIDFLIRDLGETQQLWKILVIHHPPFTSKSTDFDGNQIADDLDLRSNIHLLMSPFGGLEGLGVVR